MKSCRNCIHLNVCITWWDAEYSGAPDNPKEDFIEMEMCKKFWIKRDNKECPFYEETKLNED